MLHKEKYYRERIWPKWLQEFRHASRSALLLHGIMGSELYDKREQDTVWVDMGIWHEVDNLELKKLTPKGAIDTDSQFLYARSTVHPPVVSDPYSEILEQLNPGRFNYDWRDSIPIEAQRLAQFLDVLFNEHNEPIQFVTHSMGGCVLLWLLSQTDRFDDRISRIIFVAPPFHGALKPIRVIEEGTGTPADWLIRNSVLRRSAATFPGLFQLLVAQKGAWPTELPRPASTPIRLKHPIRAAASLYDPGAWTNRYRMRLRGKILEFAKRFHHRIWNQASRIVQRQGLAGKITVLVGLNGKTAYSATRHDREWQIHRLEFGTATVTGRVVSKNDEPIERARVTVYPSIVTPVAQSVASAATDASGRFKLEVEGRRLPRSYARRSVRTGRGQTRGKRRTTHRADDPSLEREPNLRPRPRCPRPLSRSILRTRCGGCPANHGSSAVVGVGRHPPRRHVRANEPLERNRIQPAGGFRSSGVHVRFGRPPRARADAVITSGGVARSGRSSR